MVGVPVYCPHCGALFQSRMLAVPDNSSEIHLEGNQETCPVCGHLANMIDGVFSASDGILALISGPKFSRGVLIAFSELLRQATNRAISGDELKQRATEIDPKLGEVVSQVYQRSKWPLVVLIITLAALKGCNFNLSVSLDVNKLWEQMGAAKPVVFEPDKSADKDAKNAASDQQSSNSKPAGDRSD